MDILDIAIHLFIWTVVLALSTIPGIMIGSILEVSFGRFAFWPGFLIGAGAFITFVGQHLYARE